MARVFKGRVKNWGNLDYVTLWFAKARDYALATDAPFAFVATNSIMQGVQVPELWPHLLENLEIRFAYRSFKWSNLAACNAGVTCVIIGMGRPGNAPKRLFDGDTVGDVEVIGPISRRAPWRLWPRRLSRLHTTSSRRCSATSRPTAAT